MGGGGGDGDIKDKVRAHGGAEKETKERRTRGS